MDRSVIADDRSRLTTIAAEASVVVPPTTLGRHESLFVHWHYALSFKSVVLIAVRIIHHCTTSAFPKHPPTSPKFRE